MTAPAFDSDALLAAALKISPSYIATQEHLAFYDLTV